MHFVTAGTEGLPGAAFDCQESNLLTLGNDIMRFHGNKRRPLRPSRRGVITLEWLLLITVVVIGVVGGLGVVRNALLEELHELAICIQSLNVCTP